MPQLPEALYSVAQMRELDRRAIEDLGVPQLTLMTRAGSAAWKYLQQRWPQAREIVVLAGSGNNAGDGYVLAAQAQRAKRQVLVVTVGATDKLTGAAAAARNSYLAAKGREQAFNDGLPEAGDVLVDALFGVGLTRPVEGRWALAIQLVNASGKPVLAVDVPSGLNADSGTTMGSAIHAAATVTFIGLKAGLFTGAGPACTGEIELSGLDLPSQAWDGVQPVARLVDDADARLPARARNAHKGDFGRLLVIGGDHGMAGAVRLTAEAALRSGAGLVTVVTRPEHVGGLLAGLPEAMVRGADDGTDIAPLLESATVVAAGPGLGQGDWGRLLLARALDTPLPMVVDADGLNLLARHRLTRGQWIFTPHPGEAARLLQRTVAEIQWDRLAAAARITEEYRAVTVLKGAGSVITGPEEITAICRHGNPGMAAPGMGDALTGIIAAFVAQGLPLAQAARAGVQVHARAGDRASQAGERGLMARDLIAELRTVINA